MDLEELTNEFIRTRLNDFKKNTAPDEATVRAVSGKDMERTSREEKVRNWLSYYRVTLFFPPEKSKEISRRIIEFADGPRSSGLFQNHERIILEYKKLKGLIQPVAPLSPKSGKPREVTSLTSKALWCCYPEDIPIFDDYALRSLQVISRLCQIAPKSGHTGYDCFVDVWFQLYNRVKPVIDQADLGEYPYKIRVLDGILWYLGKSSFDIPVADATTHAM